MRNGLSCSEAGKLGWIASRSTHQKKKKERLEKYYANPKRCKQCNKPISYEKRYEKVFCDHSCAAIFNNAIRESKYPPRYCLNCDKILSRFTRKYCSRYCQHDYKWKQKKEEIKRTGIIKNVVSAKRYLLETCGHQCSICHTKTWQGQPIPLEWDHINGHYDDHRVKNQRLICGNCGMLLPTYKGRNVGNGRFSRRQRYKEGKSY